MADRFRPKSERFWTRQLTHLTESRPGFVATVVWAEVYWVLIRAYGFARLDVVAQLSELSMADEIRPEDPSSRCIGDCGCWRLLV